MIRQLLAYPLHPAPPLFRVSSIETLRRHFQLLDYGTNPVAAEYLEEIRRRESQPALEAAA